MSELAFLSATELAAKVAAKEVSAVELLQMYLARVDAHNPDLNAICVDIREQTRLWQKASRWVFFMASP